MFLRTYKGVIMNLVTCLINVVFLVTLAPKTQVPMMSKEQVVGRVITQNSYNYIVDFSIEADSKKYVGDYSKVLVPKMNCVITAVASR